VLAVLGDAAGGAAQHGVGLGRAVGRDHVDGLARIRFAVDLPEDVEQARVHLGRLVHPPVAQEPVELLEPVLVVGAAAAEGHRRRFAGVGVEEAQRAGLARGLRVPRHRRGREKHGRRRREAVETRRSRPLAAPARPCRTVLTIAPAPVPDPSRIGAAPIVRDSVGPKHGQIW
jgi:hypothetical protein